MFIIKNLVKVIIFTHCVFSLNLLAANVDVKVNPETPVKNENFSLIFTVNMNSEEEPYVSFDPGKAEVLGRSNQSSNQVTIINGKIARQRSTTFIYDMISTKSGTVYIKDIVVDVDGEQLKYKNFKIKILDKRSTPANVFLQVETKKNQYYVGEGFDVNYYLYTRVNIMGVEVKAFPKLKSFSKRFKMVRDGGVVVEHNGVMYRKLLKYSARVFAQMPGAAKLDPLQLTVQYTPSRSRGSSFGLFGSAFSRPRVKNIRSKKANVSIISLPAEGVPSSFTGLVGEHTFNFNIPRNKLLVNEAVEAKFEVEGFGALESYDAYHLYKNDDLESFDTKSDLVDISHIKKKKVFEYTYLARAPFLINKRVAEFSYFDPVAKKYIIVKLDIPALSISGSAIPSQKSSFDNSSKSNISNVNQNTSKSNSFPMNIGSLIAPSFDLTFIKAQNNMNKLINIILLTLIILIVCVSFFFTKKSILDADTLMAFKTIDKKGINYSRLYKVLSYLTKDDKSLNIIDSISDSDLPESTKSYFRGIAISCETSSYKSDSNKKVKYENKHFTILKDYLKKSKV